MPKVFTKTVRECVYCPALMKIDGDLHCGIDCLLVNGSGFPDWCPLPDSINGLVSKEKSADDNLIAAAPEMLEALKKVLDTWEKPDFGVTLYEITSLIAKAEGSKE